MHRIQFVCFVVITLMFFKLLKCSGNRHMQPFIVNGKYAKIEKFPHSVYLEMRCWRDYLGAITWELSNCGSSILNQMILLTAAHCLDFCIERGEIVAVAGHENVNKATAIRRVKSILLHENYSDMSFADDIALVFLEESLPLGNTMKRVILTKQNSVGLTAMIAGWGLINDDERREEKTYILRSAPQIVRSNRDCFVPEWRMTGLLCAGSTNINQPRATRGDSGSALVIENYKQIGLAALRFLSHPSLMFYTNTSYYYDWIKENSQLFLNCKFNNTQNKIRNYHEFNW